MKDFLIALALILLVLFGLGAVAHYARIRQIPPPITTPTPQIQVPKIPEKQLPDKILPDCSYTENGCQGGGGS